MSTQTISAPALQLLEMMRSSPVLQPIVADNPDLVAVLIQSAEVAAKMSSDRSRLIDAVNRAADESDRVLEAIRDGKAVELMDRLLTAGREIDALGKVFQEFVPISTVSSDVCAAN